MQRTVLRRAATGRDLSGANDRGHSSALRIGKSRFTKVRESVVKWKRST